MKKSGNMKKTQYLAISGIFAALITVMTAYICHIPVGINGGYVHMGDGLMFLAVVLLPKSYAILASVIGAGLADALTAPMWVPATIIIKAIMLLPFSSKGRILSVRNIFSLIWAFAVSALGYYVAEYLIFETASVFWVSLSQAFVQFAASVVVFALLAVTLEKSGVRKKWME